MFAQLSGVTADRLLTGRLIRLSDTLVKQSRFLYALIIYHVIFVLCYSKYFDNKKREIHSANIGTEVLCLTEDVGTRLSLKSGQTFKW